MLDIPLPPEAQTTFRLLRKLPPTEYMKEVKRIIEVGAMPCAFCMRMCAITEFPLYNSGVIKTVLIPLCNRCRPTFKDCARMVCFNCKLVVGWVDPHTDKDKFIFKSAASYHIQACPSCVPGLEKSDIVEKVIYLEEKYKQYKTNKIIK